jgi:glycosyltransferase involved in cell wall biosynthesis
VPASTMRPRRASRTTWHLRCHRVAMALMRAMLRGRRARRPARRDPTKVTILLVHAWGMGGTIRTMLNVAGRLAERHEVEVLSVWRTRDEPFFAFPPGVTVRAAEDRRPGAGGAAARLLRRVPGSLLYPGDRTSHRTTLWTDVQLVRALWRVRSGVLIGTRPALNLLVSQVIHGPALVATEHAPFQRYNASLEREIRHRYAALDAVVVLGEGERAALERVTGGATPVHVIPNAVPALPGGRSPLEAPVVVAVGRLHPIKGFDRLIRAFAAVASEHPEWRLRICGSGGERRALKALIAELGLEAHVRLAGRVSHIERELERASIFVLSSRAEGLPLAMLEAMSKGVPVVSFACPTGPVAVIAHGVDGLLVANGDEAALGRAIATLIEDEPLRRRLGAAAVRKAGTFGLDTVGERWEALITSLTTGEDVPPFE